MKKTNILMHITICAITVASVSLFSVLWIRDFNAQIPQKQIVYNHNPDLSDKFPSEARYAMADMEICDTTEDLVKYADTIVIVKVLDNGTLIHKSLTGNPELDAALEKKGEITTLPATLSKVEVIEHVAGKEIGINEILIYQNGEPLNDKSQKKLRKGEKLLLILSPFDLEKDIYMIPGLERHAFYINDLNIVTSMSDLTLCARYDGLSLGALKKDLTQAFEKVKAWKQ